MLCKIKWLWSCWQQWNSWKEHAPCFSSVLQKACIRFCFPQPFVHPSKHSPQANSRLYLCAGPLCPRDQTSRWEDRKCGLCVVPSDGKQARQVAWIQREGGSDLALSDFYFTFCAFKHTCTGEVQWERRWIWLNLNPAHISLYICSRSLLTL